MQLSWAKFHFENVQNLVDDVLGKRDNQYQIGELTHLINFAIKKKSSLFINTFILNK